MVNEHSTKNEVVFYKDFFSKCDQIRSFNGKLKFSVQWKVYYVISLFVNLFRKSICLAYLTQTRPRGDNECSNSFPNLTLMSLNGIEKHR